MGFAEILTIVFIVLKLMGVIDWAWALVLLPEIIMLAIYAAVFLCGAFGTLKVKRKWR